MKKLFFCVAMTMLVSKSCFSAAISLSSVDLGQNTARYGQIVYPSDTTITTGFSVIEQANENVLFLARQSIDLKPGLWIKPGALFDAKIDTSPYAPDTTDSPNFYVLNPKFGANQIGKFYLDTYYMTVKYCSQMNIGDPTYVSGDSRYDQIRIEYLNGRIYVLQPSQNRIGEFDVNTGALLVQQGMPAGTKWIYATTNPAKTVANPNPPWFMCADTGLQIYQAALTDTSYSHPIPYVVADLDSLYSYDYKGGVALSGYGWSIYAVISNEPFPTNFQNNGSFISNKLATDGEAGTIIVLNGPLKQMVLWNASPPYQLNGMGSASGKPAITVNSPYFVDDPRICYVFAQPGARSLTTHNTNQVPVIVSAPWSTPDTKLPKTSTLSVAAFDPDNAPSPLTFTWSKVSGPGKIRFASNGTIHASSCKARFSESGTYMVKVTVSDGKDSISEDLSLVVDAVSKRK